MTSTSDRRGFLRHLAGELARGAKEVAPALSPRPLGGVLDLPGLSGLSDAEAAAEPAAPRTVPAHPATRCASMEELLALAAEVGLERRLDAVRALARRSLRIVPAPAGSADASQLGGMPPLPPDVAWPDWNGDPLPFLARIDLSAMPDDEHDLPGRGSLYVFYAAHGVPSGLRLDHAGAVAVRYSEAEPVPPPRLPKAARRPGGHAMALSAEHSLPRAWSAPVDALELEPEEQSAWQELRRRLAELQGVALLDEAYASDGPTALHRLLGHPDERRGDMPLACEAAARGIDLAEQTPYAHEAARELEAAAGRWRLLLQLSADDDVGWSWHERRERLYLWIDTDDLRARDFSRVWAIPQ
jgi:uncharacterized protein YwqG